MKILVPTDFSQCSLNAAEYAANMAENLHAQIVLLHLVFFNAIPHASVLNTYQMEKELMDHAKKRMDLLTHRLKAHNKKLVTTSHIVNDIDLKAVIETFATGHKIDLIVMGTKGASGLTKILFGSNTADVISNSSIPVLAVPEMATFQEIRNIIYASDMASVDDEIKQLIPLARSFKAGIRLLHICSPGNYSSFDKRSLARELISRHKYAKISVHIAPNDDIKEGLQEFIASLNVDMLVMFTHRLTVIQKLLIKSETSGMAFQLAIPLLAFKKPWNAKVSKIREREYTMD